MPLEDITNLVEHLQNEALTTKKPKVLEPYQTAARWIPLAVGPFININAALFAGAAKVNNLALPANTTEEDLENFEEFMKFCPELKQAIRSFDGDVDVLEQFVGHLSQAACNSRADDTSSCRKATRVYVSSICRMSSRVTLEKKCDRGGNNPYTARLLCPLKYLDEFDKDPETFMTDVLGGRIKIKASQWPSFLYPLDTSYDRDCLEDGLFKGKVLILFLRNICTGPTSATDGIRRASKPSKAEIHQMERVTGRCIAYVAVQAYFTLSSIEQWSSSPQEGFFNLEDFYTRCVKLFETDPDDDWVVQTLDDLTHELPSLKRAYKRKRRGNFQPVSSDDSDEDETKLIEAQRKARRQERRTSIENGTPGNTHFGGADDNFELGAPATTTNTPRHASSSRLQPADGQAESDMPQSENDSELSRKRSTHINKKGKGRAV